MTEDRAALERQWQADVLHGATQPFETWLEAGTGTRAPEPATEAGAARPLSVAEVEVVRAFNVTYRQLGLDRSIHRAVMRDGMAGAFARRVPGEGESAPGTTPEAAWAEIGAAAALGTLLVSGATKRRKRMGRHPAGAGFEPLELARMSGRRLAWLFLRRVARRFRQGLGGSPQAR